MNHAILLISCPDAKGITATVTNFIYQNQGNIIHADQHIDDQNNTFLMRIEWSLGGFRLEKGAIGKEFSKIAEQFQMNWELSFTDDLPRVAIFVSKQLHCLHDLLFQYFYGQLRCKIPLVISNHDDARLLVAGFKISFHHVHVTPENKKAQERREIELLKKEKIDLIVLARYHQILSPEFVSEFPRRIINIHHSFLPAFAGKNPYQQAYQKGVKVIGATSHYVNDQLDEGPIIAQDTVQVSHRDTLEDFIRKGMDVEKAVLNRTVHLALQRKILSYGNKTVVFD
ncbi:MAG: formyltetrahydrofolate deformylase [Candidatus Omnitrophica bacterium]|nr:formyltetrahydrofolate deformylase [Candidatus Omnitrophota bacterium]